MYILLLYLLPLLVVFLYKLMDYWGFWDYVTGRSIAISGLERLKTTTGYPASWIYNDSIDKKEFDILFNIIKRHTDHNIILAHIKAGKMPGLLTTGGTPIVINGLPIDWEQKNISYYSQNHPIIMCFGVKRNDDSKGQADKCCSIGELERWIDNKKRNREFWLGTVVVTLFSIISIIIRLRVGA